jgi:DNA-directed RNA polymerase beta' subunit
MNRLEGKKGRFRSNLQAKYVDEVGYSIVGPNADLAIDEVGVPIKMCMGVGIEETVTKDNIGDLQDAVRNGAFVYPGALSICKDGNTYNKAQNGWPTIYYMVR